MSDENTPPAPLTWDDICIVSGDEEAVWMDGMAVDIADALGEADAYEAARMFSALRTKFAAMRVRLLEKWNADPAKRRAHAERTRGSQR